MSVCVRFCLLLLVLLQCASPAFAQLQAEVAKGQRARVRESITTANFFDVRDKVAEFVTKHTQEQVLLVVDIDNTLLAMNQDLGSDQWFNWQVELQENEPDSPDLVAKKFSGLLDVQGTLFALSEMHAPEPDLPSLIKQIQGFGVTTVVLTSRGPNFRDTAERELGRNGYDFTESALPIDEKRGLFMPFDPDRPDAHGLSTEITKTIKSRLRAVTYANGIYMTAGQHKGYMLRTLLARAIPVARAIPDRGTLHKSRSFQAIVFVDDHPRHTAKMCEAFEHAPLDLVTFRYSREDGNVRNFEDSAKKHVVHDWNRLKDFVDGVLVK